MKKTKIQKILNLLIIATIFFTANAYAVNAQTAQNMPDNSNVEYTLLEPLPDLDKGANSTVSTIKFSDYVKYTFNLFVALSAAAAVFMIVLGGFQYITTDSWMGKNEGVKKVTNALLGLLLVLGSYLLLRTIDPRLVEIPSTLVKPLKIEYKNERDRFLSKIETDIKQYGLENQQLTKNITEAYLGLNKLDADDKNLRDSIREIYGDENLTDEEVDQICEDYWDNELIEVQCMELQLNNLERTEVKTNITYSQAIGIMNAQIQKCYGINHTQATTIGTLDAPIIGNTQSFNNTLGAADCIDKIKSSSKEYQSMLLDLSRPEKAQYVKDYQKYSEAIVVINNSVLKNMKQDPSAINLINSLQSVVSTVGTIGGGVVAGGPIGTQLGFAGAQQFNGYINNIVNEKNKESAKIVIAEITYRANQNLKQISTPEIKEQLKAQTNAILRSLGGTPII
jgi:hypothetical protein